MLKNLFLTLILLWVSILGLIFIGNIVFVYLASIGAVWVLMALIAKSREEVLRVDPEARVKDKTITRSELAILVIVILICSAMVGYLGWYYATPHEIEFTTVYASKWAKVGYYVMPRRVEPYTPFRFMVQPFYSQNLDYVFEAGVTYRITYIEPKPWLKWTKYEVLNYEVLK